MKRLLTLASAGLFATGLAIFPVSVFAQSNAPATSDTKAQTTAPVTGHDAKPVPAGKEAAGKDATKPATVSPAAVSPAAVSKDATKAATAKAGSVKVGTTPAPTSTPAKVGG